MLSAEPQLRTTSASAVPLSKEDEEELLQDETDARDEWAPDNRERLHASRTGALENKIAKWSRQMEQFFAAISETEA